jgi:hypothetical protein
LPVEAFRETRTHKTVPRGTHHQKPRVCVLRRSYEKTHRISKSRRRWRLLRLYRSSSAVRKAYEQYKDAPLSGFTKCHEKEACTVNVSEKTPQKHFQVVQYRLRKTGNWLAVLAANGAAKAINNLFHARYRTGLVRF